MQNSELPKPGTGPRRQAVIFLAVIVALVAVPLRWDELSSPSLTATSYNVKNLFERLGRVTNP